MNRDVLIIFILLSMLSTFIVGCDSAEPPKTVEETSHIDASLISLDMFNDSVNFAWNSGSRANVDKQRFWSTVASDVTGAAEGAAIGGLFGNAWGALGGAILWGGVRSYLTYHGYLSNSTGIRRVLSTTGDSSIKLMASAYQIGISSLTVPAFVNIELGELSTTPMLNNAIEIGKGHNTTLAILMSDVVLNDQYQNLPESKLSFILDPEVSIRFNEVIANPKAPISNCQNIDALTASFLSRFLEAINAANSYDNLLTVVREYVKQTQLSNSLSEERKEVLYSAYITACFSYSYWDNWFKMNPNIEY